MFATSRRGVSAPFAFTAVVFLWICLALALAGCNTTPGQRVAWLDQHVSQARDVSASLDGQVPALREQIDDAQAELVHAEGDLAEKLREFLAEAKPKLDAMLAEKTTLDASLAQWSAELEAINDAPKVTAAEELRAWGSGVQAAAPLLPSPWSVIAQGVGGLLVLGSTAFGLWQREQRRETDRAFTETVLSVNSVLGALEPAAADTARGFLRAGQSPATQSLIKRTRPERPIIQAAAD